MADKVFINGRAAIHAGSAGKSVAFPDVCLCPPGPPTGPVPTPLPNTAQAADLQGAAATVTIEGNRVAHAQSFIAKSTGNEVARSTGGGIITHQVQGAAYFQTFSMNVLIENQPAVRHLDLLTHNHMAKTPGNTPPAPWMSAMLASPGPAPRESEKSANEGKDWLEISMGDPEGNPIPGARFRVTTAKGKSITGSTPPSGKTRISGLAKGKCKVEWLDPVADVAKDGKAILSGTPAADHVATGASYKYVLNLERIRIRVLDHFGKACRNADCDVWSRPLGTRRSKTDGKGWLEIWSPPGAKYVDLRVVRPRERTKRRVHLKPLVGDDRVATKQRLSNLGYYDSKKPDEDLGNFKVVHAIEQSETSIERHLAAIESDYLTSDDT